MNYKKFTNYLEFDLLKNIILLIIFIIRIKTDFDRINSSISKNSKKKIKFLILLKATSIKKLDLATISRI